LEQISDWLTKILVGVGLTQLSGLRSGAQEVVAWLTPGLGNAAGAPMLAFGLTAYGLVAGFLVGYLWTRLDFFPTLSSTEQRVEAVAEKIKDTIARMTKDRDTSKPTASAVVGGVLNPSLAKNVTAVNRATEDLERAGGQLDAVGYRALGKQLVAAGRPGEALRVYERALEVDPSDHEAHTWAGAILAVYIKDFAGARSHYTRALTLNPDFLPAAYNLACLYVREGNVEDGLRQLTDVIKREPAYRDRARRDSERDGAFAAVRNDSTFKELVHPRLAASAGAAPVTLPDGTKEPS
jgi:hypothetical protein